MPDEQFVQVIYEGESKLLAVHRKEVSSAKQGTSEAGPDQLGPTVTDYYYMSPQGEMSPFKPNRDAALALFSDKQEAVQTFIQEAMLDFDNVADLARLMAFYDQQ